MTTATQTTGTGTTRKAESELRAAARRRGLTMKELAVKMGVSAGYLSGLSTGRTPWTPKMREKAVAVLGEVPGQGTVYRQGGVVTGESSFIRERARTLGMTMHDLADRVGVSYSYMTQVARGRQSMGVKVQARVESTLQAPAKVAPAKCANRQGVVVAGESSYIRERARELGMSLRDLADRVGVSYSYMSMVARGHSNMGVKVQARVASALEAPAKVAPAQPACIDREAVWDRMNAHGFSQNEVARRAGISSSNLSQVMNGRNNLSPDVLKRLHGVLFQPTKAERVMPAEVKVLGWREGASGAGWSFAAPVAPGAERQVRRRHRHSSRRPGALGREGGVRLPRRVRRHGTGLGDARRRAGLLRHAEAAGDWLPPRDSGSVRDGRRSTPGPSLKGEAIVYAAMASPGFANVCGPFLLPEITARLRHPRSRGSGRSKRPRLSRPARRRYRAACPSPAPPCVPSASRANPRAARAAPLPGSMPMMASKSSTALSYRATYMRAMPLL